MPPGPVQELPFPLSAPEVRALFQRMRSLWPQLAAWLDGAEPFALATVTAVGGSAPRAPGSCMAIMPASQRFLGSVSSGCLDVEVVEAARAALADGAVRRLRFGPDGSPPWSDGLTCGGWVEVRVEPWWGFSRSKEVRAIAPAVRGWLERDEAGVVLSNDAHHLAIAADGAAAGSEGAFPAQLLGLAQARLREGLPPCETAVADGKVFLRTVRRRPRLLLVGATDVAAHLVAFAREAGFSTTVVDPREAFAVRERFPTPPDALARSWPQPVVVAADLGPRDAAVALTHDPKIDDAALTALLETRVGYLGALGSKRSHGTRLERLRGAGVGEASLARIRGPAGLHLGTPDAAGIALGIMAGIAQWQAAEERAHLATGVAAKR